MRTKIINYFCIDYVSRAGLSTKFLNTYHHILWKTFEICKIKENLKNSFLKKNI